MFKFTQLFLITSSIVMLSFSALADDFFVGLITFDKGKAYITIENQKKLLSAANVRTVEIVKKLNSFDVISGSGVISDKQVLIENIEFVGLQNFLGYWQSGSTQLNVVDFNTAHLKAHSTIADIKYAIAPGENDSWTLFLTDRNHVHLASLRLKNDTARIDFFDADTGRIKESISLVRPLSTHALSKH